MPKGITPVIATILLLLVTISITGVSFLFVQSITIPVTTTTTSTSSTTTSTTTTVPATTSSVPATTSSTSIPATTTTVPTTTTTIAQGTTTTTVPQTTTTIPQTTTTATTTAPTSTMTIRVWILDHHETDYYHPNVNPSPVEFTRNELLPMLNEASKYHGYSNSFAQPALNYTLFGYRQVNNATDTVILDGDGYYDYNRSLFQRYDLCNYAKANDIKVVIIWGVGKWESIVTGGKGIPTNGPIMSSLCPDKTIVVYSLSYERGLTEAMEAVGHHYESVLRRFRPEYDSWSGESSPRNTNLWGRGSACGTAHNPPNARCEYDRSNADGWLNCNWGFPEGSPPESVLSDCRNWKPDRTGIKEPLDCNAWDCKNSADAGWLKWWMQNMPGIGNTLVGTDGQRIPNWWVYIADPDNCYNNPLGC